MLLPSELVCIAALSRLLLPKALVTVAGHKSVSLCWQCSTTACSAALTATWISAESSCCHSCGKHAPAETHACLNCSCCYRRTDLPLAFSDRDRPHSTCYAPYLQKGARARQCAGSVSNATAAPQTAWRWQPALIKQSSEQQTR